MSKKKGILDEFVEGVIKDIERAAIIESSRDKKTGKADPYKAAGIAAGLGYTSLDDMAQLGAMLGADGAFDDTPSSEWKLYAEDGSEFGVFLSDYEDEYDYICALEEAKKSYWKTQITDEEKAIVEANNLCIEDYQNKSEFDNAIENCLLWRESLNETLLEHAEFYAIEPTDYYTLDDFNEAVESAFDWIDFLDDKLITLGETYGIDPRSCVDEDDYITKLKEYENKARNSLPKVVKDQLSAYEKMLSKQAKEANLPYEEYKSIVLKYSDYGINPEDYKSGNDYITAVNTSREEVATLLNIIQTHSDAEIRNAAQSYFSIKYANGIYLPQNAGKKKETELKRLAKKIGLDKIGGTSQ